MADTSAVADFWAQCRERVRGLPERVPEAWAFGAAPEDADELLSLVLAGAKTATSSSFWDYEATDQPLPAVGDVSIVLDGRGSPVAVIRTTAVAIRAFDQVSDEHAYREGEGDRSLAHWRRVHETFWRAHSESDRGFAVDMPVVCEQFALVWPR